MQPFKVNACHLFHLAAVRGRVKDGVKSVAVVCANMQSPTWHCLYIMPVHAPPSSWLQYPCPW